MKILWPSRVFHCCFKAFQEARHRVEILKFPKPRMELLNFFMPVPALCCLLSGLTTWIILGYFSTLLPLNRLEISKNTQKGHGHTRSLVALFWTILLL